MGALSAVAAEHAAYAVVESVAKGFVAAGQELLDTVRKTEATLTKLQAMKKGGAAATAAAGAGKQEDMTDAQKIRLQLHLDVTDFVGQLKQLNANLAARCPSVAALAELATA